MAQLQRMDARLDTLSTEMYQMNVCVGRIAWRQATIDGFAPEATPSPPSFDLILMMMMVMTMMFLRMMMMEMLALPMRCLPDTLALCHSWQKGGIDGDQGTASKDLVQVPIGPVMRVQAKKFKDVLNGLIQELWAQANSWRPIEHDPRGQQKIITLIQVLEGSGQG